ncbi:MAG: VanZ family protein [Lachnospiraceae bacterium]|jgi:glycopeptide antibiotics resistance protein|nr:VanZ family protein [Lachnospiraceae bacterium]MCI1334514.1 VanZ family protein [Lachnospiraceae bacterium]MCI1455459.1 VanZ family protein [Lachnospiraceae bacterium]
MNSLGMYIGLLAGGFIKASPIIILVNIVLLARRHKGKGLKISDIAYLDFFWLSLIFIWSMTLNGVADLELNPLENLAGRISLNALPTLAGQLQSVAEGHVSGYANLFGNLALFVPLGIALFPYVQRTRKPLARCALTALFLSAGIEIIQLLTGRIFDLCDIVQNFAGCLFGYFLYNYAHQVHGARLPEICTKAWTKKGKAVAVVILLLSVVRIVSPV